MTRQSDDRISELWRGLRDTTPLVIGAIPFGIIFGAVGVGAGLSPGATQAMSLLVFAGSAQFIAAGLVAGGSTIPLIILTTLVVNLRHVLYGAALAPYMKLLPQRWMLPLGFGLTDESFIVAIGRYKNPEPSPYKHWYFLGSVIFMYSNWQLCTFLGIRIGQAIPDPRSWGLDFAMVVTFIGMLVPLLHSRSLLTAALTAAVTALFAYPLPNQLGLILAALAGIMAGIIADIASTKWNGRYHDSPVMERD